MRNPPMIEPDEGLDLTGEVTFFLAVVVVGIILLPLSATAAQSFVLGTLVAYALWMAIRPLSRRRRTRLAR